MAAGDLGDLLGAHEHAPGGAALAEAVGETLRAVTKLRGSVELVAPGTLPNSSARVTTRRRRPSSGWRRAISATCSGRTNMPFTFAA
jgi:hypothetical protein